MLNVNGQLLNINAFSTPPPTPAVRRLGMQKNLGGDAAGTAVPSSPKGYSIPYGTMLSM